MTANAIAATADPGGEEQARALDASDPLPTRRTEFLIPRHHEREVVYLAGNSLGLQPRSTQSRLLAELRDWATLGVDGHTEAERPWIAYHEHLREPAARLVGAQPEEVVVMNSLTVNLHLMMVSFYRPTAERHQIVIEDTAFPSDSYAVRSQAAFHGFDPDAAVVRLRPRDGEDALRTDDVVAFLEREGHRVALVLLGGVNYYSGELLDIEAITTATRTAGAVAAWDLAHAAGNVELHLHDWNVDWAAWCSYKYLNSGPGSLAGVFVHERHLTDRSLPKLAGWWSTEPSSRFAMGPVVTPVDTVDSWQVSNPPIFAMAPVLVALEMFDEVGMSALRSKSQRLTTFLQAQLDAIAAGRPFTTISPRDPAQRGAQLSIRILDRPAGVVCDALRRDHDVIADARQPDVVRFAPTPMYNTFHDCWRAAVALAAVMDARA